MSLPVGHFDVGIFLPAKFPINVQEKLFVLDHHVNDMFSFGKEQHLTLQRQKQTDRRQQNKKNSFLFSVPFLIRNIYQGQFLRSACFPMQLLCPLTIHENKQNEQPKYCRGKDKLKNLANIHYLNNILYIQHLYYY